MSIHCSANNVLRDTLFCGDVNSSDSVKQTHYVVCEDLLLTVNYENITAKITIIVLDI